jgi:hypothetical protein
MIMPMHEAFSGLFPANTAKGVSGVSGVAQRKAVENSKALPETPPRNTSVDGHKKGVSPTPAETPRNTYGHDGGVSEKTKEIQGDHHHKTPATPETPSRHNASAESSKQFHDHGARFCATPCPAIYSAQRWQQIQTDAKRFAHLWGAQVSALGRNPDNVFLLPDGLITLIEGGDILAVCEKTAVVRAPNRKQFNTIRFAALPGEAHPKWRVWASWCEP